MSLEECDQITAERIKEHFKPKLKKQQEKVINPEQLKFLLECAKQIRENLFRKNRPHTTTAKL